MIQSRRSQFGGGLVEALAVLLLITVGVVGFVKFQNEIIYQEHSAKQHTDANTIALRQLEVLRDYSTPAEYDAISSGSSVESVHNTTYNVTWTVTQTTGSLDYKQIYIVVTYTDRFNKPQSLDMITNIGSKEPLNSAAVMSGVSGSEF